MIYKLFSHALTRLQKIKKEKLESQKKARPYLFHIISYHRQTKAQRGQMTYPRPSERIRT